MSNLSILTGQIIQFDAVRTTDNVPINHLTFTWDWGDGNIQLAKGSIEHSTSGRWIDSNNDLQYVTDGFRRC